jgi:hypothetical protein
MPQKLSVRQDGAAANCNVAQICLPERIIILQLVAVAVGREVSL